MANALYDAGREAFLNGSINWTSDNIKMVLTDESGGAPNVSTDDFYNDISAKTVGSPSANFSSKTSTAGVADAADVTYSAVSGASVESLNIFKDTGTPSTSNLIAYINSGTGLPCVPNGGDILVAFSSGSSKIFKL